MEISEATFYNWKKQYGGIGVSELRALRQLKEDNAKLKQMVACTCKYPFTQTVLNQ